MNLRIITKNHAADPEIRFLTESISKPNSRSTAMPTAWEFISDQQIIKTFLAKSSSKRLGSFPRPFGIDVISLLSKESLSKFTIFDILDGRLLILLFLLRDLENQKVRKK